MFAAWSYCTNQIQVRVRACNTVKGFSCLGSNRVCTIFTIPPPRFFLITLCILQEVRPCEDKPLAPPTAPKWRAHQLRQSPAIDAQYEVADEYAEDRNLALEQLYGDVEGVDEEADGGGGTPQWKEEGTLNKFPIL